MSGTANGSTPRRPRPVAALWRHGAPLAAVGTLLVGLLVSVGIVLDEGRAAGQTRAALAIADAGPADPSGPPVVTDTLGERAGQLMAFMDGLAAARRTTRSGRPAVALPPADPAVWDRLAHCEARGDWTTETADGFSGGLGFAHSTWTANGGEEFAPTAARATREQQIVIAERVLADSGWGAWPGCSHLLGLR